MSIGHPPPRAQFSRDYLRDCFFDDFLTSSWYPSFSDFGANLAPTWLPTWAQNRPKIDPRAIQNPSQLASCFRSPFGSIFYRFLMDFRPQNRPKINQKSIKRSSQQHNNQKAKMLKKHCVLQYNRALGHVMLSTKIDKNRLNILLETASKSMLQLGSILEPTWLHFGRVLGGQNVAKLAPIGSNYPSKTLT